jgi:hypothetical protein
LLSIYAAIYGWWVYIRFSGATDNHLFNWCYGIISLLSTFYAFKVARHWGGFRSAIGKLIILLGVGLFSQWLGLQIWTYYNLIAEVEVPYPSLADIGYFGLVPAYTVAAFYLAKVSGVRFGLKTLSSKLLAVFVPLVSLTAAFFLFVRNVGFEDPNPIKLFFDLAYPIGEILPVTVALIVLALTSRKMSGGFMRSRIALLVFAFSFQFLTEYFFLYQSGAGTYTNGGLADLMYATSYFIMGISLVSLSRTDI